MNSKRRKTRAVKAANRLEAQNPSKVDYATELPPTLKGADTANAVFLTDVMHGPADLSEAQARPLSIPRRFFVEQLLLAQEQLAHYHSENQILKYRVDEERRSVVIGYKTDEMQASACRLESCINEQQSSTEVWALQEVRTPNRGPVHMRVELRASASHFEIAISATQETARPLPCAFTEIPTVLTATNGGAYTGTNETISALGPSDWHLLVHVLRAITEVRGSSVPEHQREIVRRGLLSINATLQAWPAVLRVDHITLIHTARLTYSSILTLRLEGISVGGQTWPSLTYSIGTSDGDKNVFVRFTEDARDCIENWYEETIDAYGPRLELRFKLPNQFDSDVWEKLSDRDRLLIAGIISGYPPQLERARIQSGEVNVAWRAWRNVFESAKAALRSHLGN